MLQLLLFIHILSVCGLFTGIGIELACLMRAHRATNYVEARAALCNAPVVGPLMGVSSLLLVVAGIWMVLGFGFGWQPWVLTAVVVTVALMILGPAVTGRRMEAMHAACGAGEGALSPEIHAARCDKALNFLVFFTLFALIAILYLMTNKPGWTGSIAAAVVALAAAAAVTGMVVSKSRQAV